jgi:hypothetical protein
MFRMALSDSASRAQRSLEKCLKARDSVSGEYKWPAVLNLLLMHGFSHLRLCNLFSVSRTEAAQRQKSCVQHCGSRHGCSTSEQPIRFRIDGAPLLETEK